MVEADEIPFSFSNRFKYFIDFIYDIIEEKVKQAMEQQWTAQKLIFKTIHQSTPSKQNKASSVIIKDEHEPLIKFADTSIKSVGVGTKESSRNEKRRLAGQRAREKKKCYVKELQQSVKSLGRQIERCDEDLQVWRGRLGEALQSSHNQANEHSFIYSELERQAREEYPDLDRINLLIDIIRNRDGANGKERTANINYAFKQAINFIFPALYRYLLITAEHEIDFFGREDSGRLNSQNWTYELLKRLEFDDRQVEQISELKERFKQIKREASGYVRRLNQLNEAIKNQGFQFQQRLVTLRNILSPVQCAFLLVFADRFKLRKELSLQGEFGCDKTHKKLKQQ